MKSSTEESPKTADSVSLKSNLRLHLEPGAVLLALPGIFIDRAQNITLRHCKVTWGDDIGEPYSHALEVWNTGGLRLDDFQGDAARPGLDAVSIHPAG